MIVAPRSLRNRVAGIYAVLLAANSAAWAAAFLIFHDHPVLLGTAVVAQSPAELHHAEPWLGLAVLARRGSGCLLGSVEPGASRSGRAARPPARIDSEPIRFVLEVPLTSRC